MAAVITVELEHKKLVGNYAVGYDDGHVERWFDVRKYEVKVEAETLRVKISAADWAKRQAAELAEPPPPTKERKCLCCRGRFRAQKNQYVCAPCKSTREWRAGGAEYSVSL